MQVTPWFIVLLLRLSCHPWPEADCLLISAVWKTRKTSSWQCGNGRWNWWVQFQKGGKLHTRSSKLCSWSGVGETFRILLHWRQIVIISRLHKELNQLKLLYAPQTKPKQAGDLEPARSSVTRRQHGGLIWPSVHLSQTRKLLSGWRRQNFCLYCPCQTWQSDRGHITTLSADDIICFLVRFGLLVQTET